MTLTQITEKGIKDGEIVNADINASAAIASSKLAKPLDFADNEKARFGNSSDLQIYHEGTSSKIQDSGPGSLKLITNNLVVENAASTVDLLRAAESGSVELYYDGSKKLETTATGCTITGALDVGTISGTTNFTSNLLIGDNVKALFGTGNDLEIYHSGIHSIIKDSGTGNLQIAGSLIQLTNAAVTASMLVATEGGAVELNYNGTKTFETLSGGNKFTGYLYGTDNAKIYLGASNDLEIYHDGSHSYIKDEGTGALRIASNSDIWIEHSGENMIVCNGDGSVELYYDNSKKFETYSYGVKVSGTAKIESGGNFHAFDNVKFIAGSGEDLQIYHDGTDSKITNSTGALYIDSPSVYIRSDGGQEDAIQAIANGAVNLYHNGNKKFETTSEGVYVENGGTSNVSIELHNSGSGRGNQIRFRNDHQNNSYIGLSGDTTGDLLIYNEAAIKINHGADSAIKTLMNGAVELYYDGSKKFETTSWGTQISGTLKTSGGGLSILTDGEKFTAGASDDLQIYHDGSHSWIKDAGTGNLQIVSNQTNIQDADNSHYQAKFLDGGAVELYYDGSKKFETQSTGAKVTGTLLATGAIYTQNELNMTVQGNKFIDTAHKDHYLYFRRINDGDAGHANHCTVNSGGQWSADFNDTSDEKLKENITAISDGAISKVKQLRPVNFDWKETDKANNVSGFIAQEIKTVLPNLVYGTEYDPTIVDEQSQRIKSTGYSVNTIGIVAHLTKALQEAITKIETLETKVAALEAA